MDFGEVLARAWQIIWRHKVLWIFGILAGCASTNTGSANFRATYQQDLPPRIQQFFDQLTEAQVAILIGVTVVIILLLVILAIFLGTIGRVGLVRGTVQADEGTPRLIFGELFSGSLPFFWRVFGLNLLVGVAAFLAALILIVPFTILTVVTLGIALLCLIPLACILIPIGWLIGVIVELASISIVVEDVGILEGVRRGWDTVRTNLGAIIVMALILSLGVGVLGGLLIGWPLALIIAPLIAGTAIGTERAFGGAILISLLCFAAYLPVLIVLGGILRGYIGVAWTLTYRRLTGRSVLAEAMPA